MGGLVGVLVQARFSTGSSSRELLQREITVANVVLGFVNRSPKILTLLVWGDVEKRGDQVNYTRQARSSPFRQRGLDAATLHNAGCYQVSSIKHLEADAAVIGAGNCLNSGGAGTATLYYPELAEMASLGVERSAVDTGG